MDSMLAELEKMASSANDVTREKLIRFAVDLQRSLETPADTIHRLIFLVCVYLFSCLVTKESARRVDSDYSLFNWQWCT